MNKHKILGIIFLVVVAILVIAGIYYWQYGRVMNYASCVNVGGEVVSLNNLGGGAHCNYKGRTYADSVPTQDQTADWKTYTNTQYGFEFEYPTDWTLKQATEPEGLAVPEGWSLYKYINDKGDYEGMITIQLGNNDNLPSGDKPVVISSTKVDINGQTADRAITSFGADRSLSYKMNLKNNPKLSILFRVYSYVGGTSGIRSDYNDLLDELMKTFKFTK